eukprot:evm.model.NODE_34910_length_16098_cov_23.796434.3
MPYGIGAITSGAWAAQGWAQVLIFCSALEVLAPQKEDKIPGDVQPDTSAFAKLDEKTEEEALKYQNNEINNGRYVFSWKERRREERQEDRLSGGLATRRNYGLSSFFPTLPPFLPPPLNRLAMVAWLGATVGALLTNGEHPVTTLLNKLG